MARPLSHNGLVILKVKDSDPKETYEGLLWTAEHKGYKSGWVAHKFREIFGKWPKPLSAVSPRPPESLLQEYLGISRIRYRAKMKREEKRNETSQSDRPNPLLVSR